MTNINITKIGEAVVKKLATEQKITRYKAFYREHLISLKNRGKALLELNPVCSWYNTYKFTDVVSFDREHRKQEIITEKILDQYFSPTIKDLYNRPVQYKQKQNTLDYTAPFWAQLIVGLVHSSAQFNEKFKAKLEQKAGFVNFLYSCLYCHGLAPEVNLREPKLHKRYNILIEHNFKSKEIQKDYAVLLSLDNLKSDFLDYYHSRKPILINGKLIQHRSIYKCTITTTLLSDDEIELFSKQRNFSWTKKKKEELNFLYNCVDETTQILKNPESVNALDFLRNGNIYFISKERIEELEKCKTKTFDITKLIQLCKETNQSSLAGNSLAVSFLVRAVIDHVPPIFGFKNFSEVANNYKGGTRSFKETMVKLDTSLRKIADNNLHSQIRPKEVRVNKVQTDFSQELDLLLGEVVRLLK